MKLEHAEDLSLFIAELNSETDRGLPLVATSLIDEKLHDTIESFLTSQKSSSRLLDTPR